MGEKWTLHRLLEELYAAAGPNLPSAISMIDVEVRLGDGGAGPVHFFGISTRREGPSPAIEAGIA